MAEDGRRSAGVDGAAVPLAHGGAGDRTVGSEQDGQRLEYGVKEKKMRKGEEKLAFPLLFWYN